MQLGGNAGLLQREIKAGALFRAEAIVIGVHEKCRRRGWEYGQIVGYGAVAEDEKVRPVTLAFHGVGRAPEPQVEFRSGARGQISARREPHEPYSRRIEIPFLRPAADQAHRALRVLERGVDRIVRPFGFRQPVFQHEAGDPDPVQPLRHVVAFFIDGDVRVATTRSNHHGGSGGVLFGGEVHGEGRLMNIRNGAVDDPLAPLDPDLFPCHALRAGSAIRPQIDYGRRSGAERRNQHQADQQESRHINSRHSLL